MRPPAGSPTPERTLEQYCTYDDLNQNYGYKDAYVKKLIRECSTEKGFRKLLGTAPKDKVTGDWVGEPPATGAAQAVASPSQADRESA